MTQYTIIGKVENDPSKTLLQLEEKSFSLIQVSVQTPGWSGEMRCILSGRPAEVAATFCYPGSLVLVEGQLRLRKGKKRQSHYLAVSRYELLAEGRKEPVHAG